MVRKLIVSALVSLDGYIADQNGDVLGLERFYHDHLPAGKGDFRVPKNIDTIIVGKKTYESYRGSLAQMKQKKIIILTHQFKPDLPANMSCFAGEVSELFESLQAISGKDIWLFGGAKAIDQFVCYDLIDQIRLVTLPFNLEHGTMLFDVSHKAPTVKLESLENKNEMTYSIWTRWS